MPNQALGGADFIKQAEPLEAGAALSDRADFGGGGVGFGLLAHLGCNNRGLVTMPMMSAVRLRRI
jgi:hypothetical protein